MRTWRDLVGFPGFVRGLKEYIADRGRWLNWLLGLFFIIWLTLGVIIAVRDGPPKGLIIANVLAASALWGVVLWRLKGTRIHLWLKTHIPFWEIMVIVIYLMMALSPVIANSCLH